jgi:hypothetical protein
MSFSSSEYEKILKEGNRVDWYGVLVPEKLITPSISMAAENLSHELDKLESTLIELRGSDKEKRVAYISAIRNNLRNLPYTLNGDFYLIKKNRIEKEILETEAKTTKPKTTKTKKTKSSNLKTKNSNLIFGKK